MNLKKKYFLLASLILFIILRILFLEYPFWGLEYEDSFIYYDNALNIQNNIKNPDNFFQCVSCSIGSYKDCVSYVSYGAHYNTFSYVVFFINSLVGNHYSNIFILNLLLSIFILISYYIFDQNYTRRIIFTLLLTVTPFYPLFSTSGNSEIFSSFFVLLAFLSTYRYSRKKKTRDFILFLLFAGLASISNRENFILFIAFGCVYFYLNPKFNLKLLKLGVLLSTFCFFLLWILQVFLTEQQYSDDIQNPTFSLIYLWDNTIALIRALFTYKLWGVSGFLLIFALTTYLFYNRKNLIVNTSAIFLALYYLITFLHYRHYNYLLTGQVTPFETLRYTTTFFPLLTFFITHNLHTLVSQFKVKFSLIIGLVFIPFLILQTIKTRKEFSNDEAFSRIDPALEVLKFYREGDLIIADFPIVIKNYASEETMVADIRYIKDVKFNMFNNVYLLIHEGEKDIIHKNYEINNISKKNNYEIFKIKKRKFQK